MSSGDTDASLWRAARAGDADAYAELYDRHADTIYRYLFRRVGDWSDAEDLTALTFLEAYRRRRDAVVVDDRILPWLYGIATNVLRSRRRSVRRHRRVLARLARPGPTPDFAPDAAARASAAQEARVLLAQVERLPRAQRDVVALCLWQELPYEDAAAALGIPIGTVRSRLSRARAALTQSTPLAPTPEREVTP